MYIFVSFLLFSATVPINKTASIEKTDKFYCVLPLSSGVTTSALAPTDSKVMDFIFIPLFQES